MTFLEVSVGFVNLFHVVRIDSADDDGCCAVHLTDGTVFKADVQCVRETLKDRVVGMGDVGALSIGPAVARPSRGP